MSGFAKALDRKKMSDLFRHKKIHGKGTPEFTFAGGIINAYQNYILAVLFLNHFDLQNFVTLTDQVNYFESFYHFTKAGMTAIEMRCVRAAVANKEL